MDPVDGGIEAARWFQRLALAEEAGDEPAAIRASRAWAYENILAVAPESMRPEIAQIIAELEFEERLTEFDQRFLAACNVSA